MTTSSAKAEYVAMTYGIKEEACIQRVLAFLAPGMRVRSIRVSGDTVGPIDLANNPHRSVQSRYIDARRYSLKELAAAGRREVKYIETLEKHGDVLRKPLANADTFDSPVFPLEPWLSIDEGGVGSHSLK